MSQKDMIDKSFWFSHKNGKRLYPTRMTDSDTGCFAFRVTESSNKTSDATQLESIDEVIEAVFGRGLSVRMRELGTGKTPSQYGLNKRAIAGWGANPELKPLIERLLGSAASSSSEPQALGPVEALSTGDYRRAIDAANLSPSQQAWLTAHASRPGGRASMRQLSSDVGHVNWETANLLYGTAAGRIAEHLPYPPASLGGREPTQKMQWIADGVGKGPDGESVWRLFPEVAAALAMSRAPESESVGSVQIEADIAAALDKLDRRLAEMSTTERTGQVRQRVGQSLFRELLGSVWQERCAITGLAVPELLRASHAKPWAACKSDRERLDPFNGFLVAPNLDALFDRGFLSFDDGGGALWADGIDQATRAQMGLPSDGVKLRHVDVRHLPYLLWHRTYVFCKLQKEDV